MNRRSVIGAMLLAAMAGGCRHEVPNDLPKYPRMTAGDVLAVLRQRARAVRTVSAEGLLTLTRPDGESVRLDAAFVARSPGEVRLRAWKLGRAIFDLTLTPDGLWLLNPEDRSLREKVRSAGVSAGELAKMWAMLSAGFFDRADLIVKETETELQFMANEGTMSVRCEVDRETLTPVRYVLADRDGMARFTLELQDYRRIQGIVHPRRFVARSEQGTIELAFREMELNGELPAGAFVPPKRAERLP